METDKIINLLEKKMMQTFATKKWYVIEVKLQKLNTIEIILSSLKQKLLNQIFMTILMHLL